MDAEISFIGISDVLVLWKLDKHNFMMSINFEASGLRQSRIYQSTSILLVFEDK